LGKNIKAHLCSKMGYLRPYPARLCPTCKNDNTPTIYLNEEQFEALNEHYTELKRKNMA